MLKQFFLAVLFFLFIAGVSAQINVSKVSPAGIPSTSEGIFYALPLTVIQIDIIVNKVQNVKGPYAEFADQMLGLSQVISNNSIDYELKDIRLTAYAEPDPLQYYFIQKPGKQKDNKNVELFLSDEGIISGISALNQPEKARKQQSFDISSSRVDLPEMANPSVFERMDTVIKRISLDSAIIEQKFFRKTSAAKSLEQKAREAAEFILKLDDNMYNLINGYQEVNYEKGTMEFMYYQMNSMKQGYLELFKGVSQKSSETYTYYFVPGKDNIEDSLCRFSTTKGILPKTASAGELLLIQAQTTNKTKVLKPEAEKMKTSQTELHGVFYRIPDKANVVFKVGGVKKLESQFLINQFGVVTFLPATSIRNISIDNNTGTLRRVVLE